MKAWWLPPLLLGVAVAGGAWALDALLPEPKPEEPPLLYPFLLGPTVDPACGCGSPVLAVRGGPTTLADIEAAVRARGGNVDFMFGAPAELPDPAAVEWVAPGVALVSPRWAVFPGTQCFVGSCGDRSGPALLHEGMGANRTSANVTFYAFLADGRLQATNANATEAARFAPAGDLVHLQARRFALAPGAPGAPLPAFVDKAMPGLRDELRTLPVGGVVTRVLERHDYQDVLGPLYVTLRVES